MAKASVLICDRCPASLAIGTFTLSNGRKSMDLSMDLCDKHAAEIHAWFTKSERRRKPMPQSTERQARFDKLWQPREDSILEAMRKLDSVKRNELAKITKLDKQVVGKTLERLISAGRITSESHGPGKKWKLAD